MGIDRQTLANLGTWIGNLPEAERLNRLDRLKHELSGLKERWNNRLSSQRGILRELYVGGRLSIACYFERCSSISDFEDHRSAVGAGERYFSGDSKCEWGLLIKEE